LSKRRFSLREPVVIALQSLRAHKLRSFLTLLGVIISVTTLIAVISLVEGMNTYFAERIANLGTNVFYVQRYALHMSLKSFIEARRRTKPMTIEDYLYLRDNLTRAEQVGAREFRRGEVRAGNESLQDVRLGGVTANMIDISPEKVGRGRYITQGEYERRALVAFVGTDVTERLFPQVDPLGKTLWVKGTPFLVVGVAEKLGSAFGRSQDNFVYIPLTTLHKVVGKPTGNASGVRIAVQCATPGVMEQTKDQARTLMRQRRRQKYDQKDAFGIIASDALNKLWKQIFGGLASAAIGIVSIFLLVGGIVIMNIMLASVTERTHEIGIRKSLGARRSDILLQFLVEASVLSTTGGVIGVLLALVLTELVAATTPVPMHTPLSAIVLAVGVSSAVGMFFGIYPAQKAARFDPVIALRAE